MRQRLAPPRFGDQVTEAGNTGRRAALSFGKADSEIGHRHVVGGGWSMRLFWARPWWSWVESR